MPSRKTRHWKQSIRKLPPELLRDSYNNGPEIVVGVVKRVGRKEVLDGFYVHLDLSLAESGNLGVPDEPVLPPPEMGRWSRRNVEGWEEVHRDRPKEEFINVIESPNWGDWSRGSHTSYIRGMRYPRTHHPGRNASIQVDLLGREDDDTFNIHFSVTEPLDTREPQFEQLLFEYCNLLQENVGGCGVFPASASRASYLETLHVNWTVLPPGQDEEVVRIVVGTGRGKRPEHVQERLDAMKSLNPLRWVVGFDGFGGYFGGVFSDNVVAFENAGYGNAIYVMGIDWQRNSQMSRVELLNSPDADFTRIPHTKNWKIRLWNDIQTRLAAG